MQKSALFPFPPRNARQKLEVPESGPIFPSFQIGLSESGRTASLPTKTFLAKIFLGLSSRAVQLFRKISTFESKVLTEGWAKTMRDLGRESGRIAVPLASSWAPAAATHEMPELCRGTRFPTARSAQRVLQRWNPVEHWCRTSAERL